MKLSRKWLSEFVDITASDREYAETMTLSGSKVELTEFLGREVVNVVAGNILALEKHPHADKLQLCTVDVGKTAPVCIVTGAKNVAVGDMVPVALNDSILPGGVHIIAGELRGVLSNGMLCSVKELGLTLHDVPYAAEDGILIPPGTLPAGSGYPGNSRAGRPCGGIRDHPKPSGLSECHRSCP